MPPSTNFYSCLSRLPDRPAPMDWILTKARNDSARSGRWRLLVWHLARSITHPMTFVWMPHFLHRCCSQSPYFYYTFVQSLLRFLLNSKFYHLFPLCHSFIMCVFIENILCEEVWQAQKIHTCILNALFCSSRTCSKVHVYDCGHVVHIMLGSSWHCSRHHLWHSSQGKHQQSVSLALRRNDMNETTMTSIRGSRMFKS